jgi:hypothetical protein
MYPLSAQATAIRIRSNHSEPLGCVCPSAALAEKPTTPRSRTLDAVRRGRTGACAGQTPNVTQGIVPVPMPPPRTRPSCPATRAGGHQGQFAATRGESGQRCGLSRVVEAVPTVPTGSAVAHLDEPGPDFVRRSIDCDRLGPAAASTRNQLSTWVLLPQFVVSGPPPEQARPDNDCVRAQGEERAQSQYFASGQAFPRL